MPNEPKPLDYQTAARKARPMLSARLARVSDNRWMIVALLLGFSIQSIVYPVELLHTYSFAISSAQFSLVLETREVDIFVPRVWIPYVLLVVLVLWRPLRGR